MLNYLWIKNHIPVNFRRKLRCVYSKLYKLGQDFDKQYTKMYVKICRVKRDKVVFDNFFGKGYGDNPKYIAEEIHRQKLGWDMVWLVKNHNVEVPPYLRTVIYGSNTAKRELSTAKVIVDNIRNSMRVPKKRGQIYLQTWHGGLGFKKVEGEAVEKLNSSYIECAKRDGYECDAIISACTLQSEQYRKYFWLNKDTEILEVGQPRCDTLFADNQKYIAKKVRKCLSIADNASIILYAPTFRDDGSIDGYALEFNEILDAFERKVHEKCVMIVRLHPNAQSLCSFLTYNNRIINGSDYPDIQELYLASIALITDYSSAAFDFSLLKKPVFLCMLDYEEYIDKRGLTRLFALCPFPKCRSNSALINTITQFSLEEYLQNLNRFKKEVWQPFDNGHAAQNTVEWLRNRIQV